MRKIIIFIISFLISTSAIAGDLTDNGYFYLPEKGSYGTAERNYWLLILNQTDAIIKSIVDGTISVGSSIAAGWTDGGTSVHLTTSTDNVGIGTTTSTEKLTVIGSAKIGDPTLASTITALGFNISNGTSIVDQIASTGAIGIGTTAANATAYLSVHGGNGQFIGAGTGTNTSATSAGELYVEGDLEVDGTITGDGSGLTNLPTGATAAGSTNSVQVKASGGNLAGGTFFVSDASTMVGIGTASPSVQFETTGNAEINSGAASTGVQLFKKGLIGDTTDAPPLQIYRHASEGDTNLKIYVNQYKDVNFDLSGATSLQLGRNTSLVQFMTGASAGVLSIGDQFGGSGYNPNIRLYGYLTNANSRYVNFKVSGSTNNLELSRQNSEIPLFDVQMPVNFSSGNVGIGTITPTAKLGIWGSGTGTSPSINLRDSAGTLKTTFLDNGNIGLGTHSPEQLLTVAGTVKATAFSGDGSLITGVSAVGVGGWTDGGTNVYQTLTTDVVGIGTTTPTGKLDIRGDEVRIWTGAGTNTNATASGELYVEGDMEVDGTIYGDAGGLTNLPSSVDGWSDGGTNVYTATTTDNVGIGTTTPNAATLEIIKNAAQPLLKISSAPGGSGDFLIVNSVGNVGIGTTAATATVLDVSSGSAATVLRLVSRVASSSTNGAGIVMQNKDGAVMGSGHLLGFVSMGGSTSSSASSNGGQLRSTATDTWTVSSTPGNVQILTTPDASTTLTTRLTVTEAGNVGINTVRPDSMFSVVKSGSTPLMQLSSSAGGNGDYLLVSSSGNVGIGTTTSDKKLTVTSSTGDISSFVSTSTPSAGEDTTRLNIIADRSSALTAGKKSGTIRFWGTTDSSHSLVASAGISTYPVTDWTGSNAHSRLDFETVASGSTTASHRMSIVGDKIGIGTYNPQSRFSVIGNVAIGATAASNFLQTAAPSGGLIVEGNVGIGTYKPSSALSISGVMSSTGTSPSLSSCGTGPSIVGNDQFFTITGGTSATGCIATFAGTYSNAPVCVVTAQSSGALTYAVSTTAVTITDADLSTGKIDVVCGFRI